MRTALILSVVLVLPILACRGDVGSPCDVEEDGECRRSLICFHGDDGSLAGQCTRLCERQSECEKGETCIGGLCRVACEGTDDPVCVDGTTCVGDWCRLTCDATDCRPGAECVSGNYCF